MFQDWCARASCSASRSRATRTLPAWRRDSAKAERLSTLIDGVLEGHLLALTAEGASGRLTDAAALARDELLDAVELLDRIEAIGVGGR